MDFHPAFTTRSWLLLLFYIARPNCDNYCAHLFESVDRQPDSQQQVYKSKCLLFWTGRNSYSTVQYWRYLVAVKYSHGCMVWLYYPSCLTSWGYKYTTPPDLLRLYYPSWPLEIILPLLTSWGYTTPPDLLRSYYPSWPLEIILPLLTSWGHTSPLDLLRSSFNSWLVEVILPKSMVSPLGQLSVFWRMTARWEPSIPARSIRGTEPQSLQNIHLIVNEEMIWENLF